MVGEGKAENRPALVKITSPLSWRASRWWWENPCWRQKSGKLPPSPTLHSPPSPLATSRRNEHGVPEPCPHRNHPLALGTVQTSGRRDEKLDVTPRPLRTSAGFPGRGREGKAGRRGLRLGRTRGSTPLRKLGGGEALPSSHETASSRLGLGDLQTPPHSSGHLVAQAGLFMNPAPSSHSPALRPPSGWP